MVYRRVVVGSVWCEKVESPLVEQVWLSNTLCSIYLIYEQTCHPLNFYPLSLSHSQAIPTCQIKIFILFLSSHLGRSFTKVEATARAALEPSALLYGLTPTTGLLTTIWIEVAPVACCHCV